MWAKELRFGRLGLSLRSYESRPIIRSPSTPLVTLWKGVQIAFRQVQPANREMLLELGSGGCGLVLTGAGYCGLIPAARVCSHGEYVLRIYDAMAGQRGWIKQWRYFYELL